MKIRNVLKEYETHLQPAQPGGMTEGKSEWKQYGDGTYRFKISVRNIPLPDNSRVDEYKKTKLDTENNLSIAVANINGGQILRIKVGETVLAEGQYSEE